MLVKNNYFSIILVVAIILFPLQKIAILLMGSRYDLTAFILLFLSLYSFIFFKKTTIAKIIFLAFFSIQILITLFFQISPYYRFVSGIVWLGGLLLLILGSKNIEYNQKTIAKTIIGVLLITSIYICFEGFILQIDRPQAWFYEPSFAGLCLYGGSSGVLISLIVGKQNKKIRFILILCFILLITAAILTFSMHFITFVISLIVFFLFLLPTLISIDFKKVLLFLSFGLLIFIIGANLFLSSHFQSRTDIADPSNLSLLAWLQGYDQMIAAIGKSPFFGLGLGSTGNFNFKSEYSDILQSVGKSDLTLNDAFSLAFRLIIEIGLLFFILLLIFLKKKLRKFKVLFSYYKKNGMNIPTPIIFNFVFSITVILGCFLKEPLYPQSFLYLSIFLVSSIPLYRKEYKTTN